VLLDQPHGVGRFDVFRQDEDADLRQLRADDLSGHETLVRMGWRHPDVDECNVRTGQAT
jgi:hypothetical protein